MRGETKEGETESAASYECFLWANMLLSVLSVASSPNKQARFERMSVRASETRLSIHCFAPHDIESTTRRDETLASKAKERQLQSDLLRIAKL